MYHRLHKVKISNITAPLETLTWEGKADQDNLKWVPADHPIPMNWQTNIHLEEKYKGLDKCNRPNSKDNILLLRDKNIWLQGKRKEFITIENAKFFDELNLLINVMIYQ
jgi:hypothetical protein